MAKTASSARSHHRRLTAEDAYSHLRHLFGCDSDGGLDCRGSEVWREIELLWNEVLKTRQVVELTAMVTSGRVEEHPSEKHVREFERKLYHDYREFARDENYPGEADAYAELTHVLERMRQIRLAPHLAAKNICAVGGGFSSGKSHLVNRLIDDPKLLPTGITPTTSVPTYVSYGCEKVIIRVFGHHGGSVEIERRQLYDMTHGFGRVDGLNEGIRLKAVVRRVSIRTPGLKRWQRVAFVDTPGYTNGDHGGDEEEGDEAVATREVLASRFLIWVNDCEKGGLSQQDIDLLRRFVENRGHRERSGGGGSERQDDVPIYLILNKAEKKEEERDSILESVTETLRNNKVPFFGVRLYSARKDEWYKNEGGTFDEFMDMIDREEPRLNLDRQVAAAFDRYADYHDCEVKRLKKVRGLLMKVHLSLRDREGRDTIRKHGEDVSKQIDAHVRASSRARSLKGELVECTVLFMKATGLSTTYRSSNGEPGVELNPIQFFRNECS